jgi:hypothetical protein
MTHRRIQTFREHERVFTKKEKKQEKDKKKMKKKSGLEIYENNPSAHSIFSAHRVGRGASYKYISNRQFYSLFRRLFVFLSFLVLFFLLVFCPRATKKSVTPSSLSSAMTPGIYASAIRLCPVLQQIDI